MILTLLYILPVEFCKKIISQNDSSCNFQVCIVLFRFSVSSLHAAWWKQSKANTRLFDRIKRTFARMHFLPSPEFLLDCPKSSGCGIAIEYRALVLRPLGSCRLGPVGFSGFKYLCNIVLNFLRKFLPRTRPQNRWKQRFWEFVLMLLLVFCFWFLFMRSVFLHQAYLCVIQRFLVMHLILTRKVISFVNQN